ncbi:MAG TPA: NAD(+)--rifampin ADP-ribosyltransferase [Steroidobacteraceae bacterium]
MADLPRSNAEWVPVTYENCKGVGGPFYHGTKADLAIGDLLIAGYSSNFEDGRKSNNVYFSAVLEAAVWGAELAMPRSGLGDRGRVYIVEPTGTFEDDPNLTNKRFPGNLTKSYRTREPLKVIGVVDDWVGHPADVLQAMLDSIEGLRRRGPSLIED